MVDIKEAEARYARLQITAAELAAAASMCAARSTRSAKRAAWVAVGLAGAALILAA